MGRPTFFEQNPGTEDDFAELIARGATRQEIAAAFDIHVDTVTDWRKQPGVQAKVSKLIKARANRILSQTDTKIEKMLESKKDIPMRDLLAIRTAFADTSTAEDTAPAALEELVKALHDDPEAAEALFTRLHDGDADGD